MGSITTLQDADWSAPASSRGFTVVTNSERTIQISHITYNIYIAMNQIWLRCIWIQSSLFHQLRITRERTCCSYNLQLNPIWPKAIELTLLLRGSSFPLRLVIHFIEPIQLVGKSRVNTANTHHPGPPSMWGPDPNVLNFCDRNHCTFITRLTAVFSIWLMGDAQDSHYGAYCNICT